MRPYPRRREEQITVRLEGSDYHLKGGTFPELRDAVRAIPGRHWLGPPHGVEKVWELPLSLDEASWILERQGFELWPIQVDRDALFEGQVEAVRCLLAITQQVRMYREILAYQASEIYSTVSSNPTWPALKQAQLMGAAQRYRRVIEVAERNLEELTHSDVGYFKGILAEISKDPVPFERWILFYIWDSRQSWTNREAFPHCVPAGFIQFAKADIPVLDKLPDDETTLFEGTLNRISDAYQVPVSLLPTLRIREVENPTSGEDIPVIAFEVKPPQDGLHLDLPHFKSPCPNLFQWQNHLLGEPLIETDCSPLPFDSYLLGIDRLGA